MTVRGESLLAWLDTAIAIRATAAQLAAEGGSGRWYSGGRTDDPYVEDWQLESDVVWDYDQDKLVVDNEVHPSKARSVHIALNDPEAVLRRCAADRKLLKLHNVPSEVFPEGGDRDDRWCVGCGFGSDGEPMVDDIADCPVLSALAEGYGFRVT